MVQARIFHKHNINSHYTNAAYSFLKERAQKFKEITGIVSSDAKCKISVGEPGTPIASVSRGKKVLVGLNQTFQVTDHDKTNKIVEHGRINNIVEHGRINI